MEAINSAALAGEAVRLVRLIYLAGLDKRISCDGNKMHFQILYVLCNHPPPGLTMTQLAADIQVSPQQISRLVGVMENNGLVKRKHDPGNRRRVYVRVLPAGLQEMENIIAQAQDWIVSEFNMFSPEEMRRLHECFVFIRCLLEKTTANTTVQNPPVKEEALDE
ncbi:MAG: MarR family winged helix-turn-helix transcriptional regulator [Clostridiales bacterium]|nr:MarR family winged helix-turn-helix transcriptional regulator [Clostridiales bacterium]